METERQEADREFHQGICKGSGKEIWISDGIHGKGIVKRKEKGAGASGRGDAIAGFFVEKVEGQLSLFPEEEKSSVKTKKKAKKKKVELDPSQTFDERMKRFWHYMETKGMHEQWIETSEGELRIVIEALADYYDMAARHVEAEESGYAKAAWGHRLERIKQIQIKLEESIGYNRNLQIELCRKRKPQRDDDIGEDAVILASRKWKSATERKAQNE